MPQKLDTIFQSIKAKFKGKINPRTKKVYTESDFWAIANIVYKSIGGKK